MRRFTVSLAAVFLAVGVAASVSAFAAQEARSAPYYQVVDNGTNNRFLASGRWIASSFHSDTDHGKNYRVLKRPLSVADNAKYKIRTPARGSYRVYARWPADPGYNNRTVFLIRTASGWVKRVVNQRTDGDRWVSLGTHTLKAGDSYRVQVSSKSSGKGFVIADAVKIVRKTASAGTGSDETTGGNIVREARRHLDEPYVYGGASPRTGFDCSGLTTYVYKKVAGIDLPHNAAQQYGYGKRVSKSQLRPGDLIFGHAEGNGPGIKHVGIYEIYKGRGYMIHAGTPQTDVERTPFPASWYDVVGYRRLVPAG